MLIKHVVALTVILVGFGFFGAAAAEIIVSDTFDVGASPTVGDDPDDPLDIAWTLSIPSVSGRGLVLETLSGLPGDSLRNEDGLLKYRSSLGHLPAAVALASVGDTLSLQVDFKYRSRNANVPDAYRLGLFDSSGAGYFFRFGNGTARQIAITKDDGTGFTMDDEGLTDLITATDASVPSFTVTSAYDLGIELSRTAAGLQVTATVDDYSLTYEETASPQFVFDTVASGSGDTNIDWHIDNVLVDATVVPVPEPSALALAGAASLGLLVRSRRFLHGCCSANGSV